MEYKETSKYEARYADTRTNYDVTGIDGMSDEEIQAQINVDFRCRGYWCDNELTWYSRESDGLAKIEITSPFLD